MFLYLFAVALPTAISFIRVTFAYKSFSAVRAYVYSFYVLLSLVPVSKSALIRAEILMASFLRLREEKTALKTYAHIATLSFKL